MGTNFYWRYNICSCCGRYDEQHVGKSGCTFEAVFDEDPDTYQETPRIVSWADWKRVLRREFPVRRGADLAGELWDEYGERLDVEEYIARFDAAAPEARRRQFEWVRDHAHERPLRPGRVGVIGRDCDWLDDEGYSIYGGGFS